MSGTTLMLALLITGPTVPAGDRVADAIKVSQVGYPVSGAKLAFVVGDVAARRFVVRRAGDGKQVMEGPLGEPVQDADSGDRVRTADFSKLRVPGTYVLDVAGVGRSLEFPVSRDAFGRALYLSLRSFYGQRCGTAVDLGREFPGFSYGACHPRGAYHPSSGKAGARASEKGWHDAGDYGRYVVNSGITTGTLLLAFELFPAQLASLRLDIPESGDTTPDVLDEVRWNLDWMLSMQDEDGGVWPKQTSETFVGFVMPDRDTTTSYVIGTPDPPHKTSCATADFAAVAAIAARVYRPYDAAYAQRNLDAARRAWDWVVAHPDVLFRNPEGVRTGGYGDGRCGDERLWATAELWRTTGDDEIHRAFLAQQAEQRAAVEAAAPPAWPNVAPLALWSYALAPKGDPELKAAIRRDSLAAADAIVARSAANGYRVSLVTKDYGWGSNGVVANYGLQLLLANVMRKDARYVETARDDLYYLLGRNALGLSFLTGVGARATRHPHHRPSAADANAEPWPGLLAGGPNARRQDAAMSKLPDLPPAKMYVDDEGSYATNENAVNWNAALVFLLAGASAE